MRQGQDESEWVEYQNSTRLGPLMHRFGGEDGRVERLKTLKERWDPKGMFPDLEEPSGSPVTLSPKKGLVISD